MKKIKIKKKDPLQGLVWEEKKRDNGDRHRERKKVRKEEKGSMILYH